MVDLSTFDPIVMKSLSDVFVTDRGTIGIKFKYCNSIHLHT